jgi:hypothetical protein
MVITEFECRIVGRAVIIYQPKLGKQSQFRLSGILALLCVTDTLAQHLPQMACRNLSFKYTTVTVDYRVRVTKYCD